MTEKTSAVSRPPERARLVQLLVKLASKENIQSALGITDASAMAEEFWRVQAFTAQNRFFLLCRHQLGLDLAREEHECSEDECRLLSARAQALLDEGLTYAKVRHWYLQAGRMLQALAYEHRRNQARLSSMRLSVLVVLERGAQWLQVGDNEALGEFRLVSNREDATRFPVHSEFQLEEAFRNRMAEGYAFLLKQFNAKQVKVLTNAAA